MALLDAVRDGAVAASPDVDAEVYRLAPAQVPWAQFSLTATRRLVLDFESPLDGQRLTQALAASATAFEALRTRFLQRPGLTLPVQAVSPICNLLTDKPGLDAHQGRVAAARLSVDGRQLSLDALAVALDRRSLLLWYRSIGDAYAGRRLAATVQPADAADGLAALAEDAAAEPARRFWRATLADGVPAGRLPEETGTVSGRVAELTMHWGDANHTYDTAHMLALWQSWLRRETDLADVTIGVEMPGRDAELADALGHYARILPINFADRSNEALAGGDEAARSALDRAEAWMLVAPQADGPATLRLGQLSFLPYVFSDHRADPAPSWPGDGTSGATLEDAALPCALHLILVEHGFHLAYDPGRFALATAERIAARFAAFARAAVAQPKLPFPLLPRLAPDEFAATLYKSRGPALPPSAAPSILALILQAATERPDATALIDASETRSFRGFVEEFERVAGGLVAAGVRPGDRVALVVERSVPAITGLFGILRAGAVAVPIDPAVPVLRQVGLIADVGAVLVLGSAEKAAALSAHDVRTLTVDEATLASPAPLPPMPSRDDGAYIIHTSGSTGRPKGVLVRHRNLLDSTRARLQYYLAPPRCFLLTPSLSFDSSVAGLYWTLATGGCVVLPASGEERDPRALAVLVERHQVSHWLTVPALYQAVLTAADDRQLTALTDVIVAGEACASAIVASHAARMPGVRLHNEYGPTEATVWSTCWSWDGNGVPDEIPIGGPIPGVAVYLLDAANNLVPDGAIGELHVGGIGVAAGYLGQPDGSAGAFRPDPFSDDPGARLYATGDLGRRQPDGTIIYSGRMDRQLKIRGRRIEPREIETAIETCSGVMRSAVLVREDRAAMRQLVGYVEPEVGHRLDGSAIRSELATRVPEWLLPDAIVVLDRFPMTPNGKIDTEALPAAEKSARPSYRAPDSPAATALAAVIGAMVDIKDVGLDDDFFAMGGDSLMALQIAAKLRSAGYALSVRSIFATPRLAELATAAVPIEACPAIDRSRSDDRPAPLTPIQRWFVARNLPQPRHYNQAVAFAAAEPLELARLHTALTVVADAHPALRLAVETDDKPRQRPMPIDVLVPPAWFDLRALPEQLRERTIHRKLQELQQALDPAVGRVLRAVVFRLGGDQPDLLVLIAHHLVIDARSWLILAEDLAAAYRGTVVAPAIGFPDWARALAEAEISADGWSKYLTGAMGALPRDRSVATNAESDAAEFTLSLSSARSRALARWPGGRTGRWLADAVLASLGLVLGDWTGHERVLIDVEGTGRDVPASLPDPSRTIGWLTTLAPVVVPHRPQVPRNARLAAAVASIGAAPADWTYALKETDGPRSGAALCVNFLGRLAEQNYIGELFKPAAFDAGPLRGPDNPRAHLIDLEIESGADVLELTWRYAASAFEAATVKAVAQRHLDLLISMAES
ncbi:MAG: amino acid adenylation domain-containing protein [Xanthobacteraceae bacterium]